MGNFCCCEDIPEPKVAEFLKPARFSGAVPTRYVVLKDGKIEYFAQQDKLSTDPFKGTELKGFINLYEYMLERNPKNPLMLNFVRSMRKTRKSDDAEFMPTSTRLDNYEFQCKSLTERNEWVAAIEKHTAYCIRTFYSNSN